VARRIWESFEHRGQQINHCYQTLLGRQADPQAGYWFAQLFYGHMSEDEVVDEYEEGNPTSYPAALDGVVAVGASTEVDRRAPFSNTGPHIDLVAPGSNILSTVPTYPSALASTTDYEAWPGTSMATPFVTATVALLLAKKVNATPSLVTEALHRGADRVVGVTGFTETYGHGRLNIRKTLAQVR
jgi:subtilisin family serine protease